MAQAKDTSAPDENATTDEKTDQVAPEEATPVAAAESHSEQSVLVQGKLADAVYTLTTSEAEGVTPILHQGHVLAPGTEFEIDGQNASSLITQGFATADQATYDELHVEPPEAS